MQIRNMYGNAKQGMDDKFFFKEFLLFCNKSIPSRISQTNYHLLIMGGHGSHVTLEAIEQAQEFGLNIVTLPSHISHAL